MKVWVLKKKIHPAWLIATTCYSVSFGIFLAQFFSNFSSVLILFAACLIIFIIFSKRYRYLIPVLILSGIFVGLYRGSVSQSELVIYKSLYKKVISVEGLVKYDIDVQSSGQMTVRLDNLRILGKRVDGNLWVTASSADIKRGDIITVQGKIQKGFGNYSGVIYRANIQKIIHPNPGDVGRVVRDWFSDGIRRTIPEPEASLGVGYLVGQRIALPPDLTTALQIVGLTHIVVASGYNLTIIIRFVRRIFMRISKYFATFMSFLSMTAFILITGFSPSMVRAGLVASLSLLAWYYGRKFHPIILLGIAIAITLLINPAYAWGDLGWQLSFAAFAGVMIIAPLGQRYFFGDEKPGLIRQILGETVSAQIATAPIIIFSFGQFSNIAVISNLLILPLIPVTMLATFIAGVGGLAFPGIATIFGAPATFLLSYATGLINYFASLPWASSAVNINILGLATIYLLIAIICIWMWHKTRYNLRDTNLVE